MTCSCTFISVQPQTTVQIAYLVDAHLALMHSRAAHLFLVWWWALDYTLNLHDAFPVDALGPAYHRLGDSAVRLGQHALHCRELVPEDNEHDFRAQRPDVVDPSAEHDALAILFFGDIFQGYIVWF